MENSADSQLSMFGAFRIVYKHSQGCRYYVYGFNNSLEEWDYNKGELIGIYHDKKDIEVFQNTAFCIEDGDIFCTECFRLKKINNLEKSGQGYWGRSVWNGLSQYALKELQDLLLLEISDFTWSNVKGLTDKDNPFVYYNVCSTYCINREEYNNSTKFKEYTRVIDDVASCIIGQELINGNEKMLECYLMEHISEVEPGMKVLEAQKHIDGGIIDIFAEDRNNKKCVIELKVTKNDKHLVWQSAFYQTAFDEEVRVITISPGYTRNIYHSLKNIKNVEPMIYALDSVGHFYILPYEEYLNQTENVEVFNSEETPNNNEEELELDEGDKLAV